MRINAELIRRAREEKSWSQEELAIAAGLNLRTIQRIEREAAASLQSKKAIAAALDLDVHDLTGEETRRCSDCRSTRLYEYESDVDTTTIGGELLPKLSSGVFGSAKVRPVVCAECGLLKYYAAKDAIEKLAASKHWKLV